MSAANRTSVPMKRINLYEFYELGHELHSLAALKGEPSLNEAYSALVQAQGWLERLISGEWIEVRFCKPEAERLLLQVRRVIKIYYKKKGTEEFDFEKDWNKIRLSEYWVESLKSELQRLE